MYARLCTCQIFLFCLTFYAYLGKVFSYFISFPLLHCFHQSILSFPEFIEELKDGTYVFITFNFYNYCDYRKRIMLSPTEWFKTIRSTPTLNVLNFGVICLSLLGSDACTHTNASMIRFMEMWWVCWHLYFSMKSILAIAQITCIFWKIEFTEFMMTRFYEFYITIDLFLLLFSKYIQTLISVYIVLIVRKCTLPALKY